MKIIKSLFKREELIQSNTDFWNWFEKNSDTFYRVVKNQGDIQKVFFRPLSAKLKELKEGYWYLTGMYDENTAELILTADGIIKNIVFVEELVVAAPNIKNWKITALKQPSDINKYGIVIGEYRFDESTMSFYSIDSPSTPDEIHIAITHKDLTENNRTTITNGVYLAIDNFLGELNSITTIDNIDILTPQDADEELVPLEKLKDFLMWREKEFIEKYEGTRRNTENDNYTLLEGIINEKLPLIALINKDLLNWDAKASHPWIAIVEIHYDGTSNNGMPNKATSKLLDNLEEKIMSNLKDVDGYLNIGRKTANSTRSIYFACREFRKPSKVLYKIINSYTNQLEIEFDIYKDKYWQSFEQFRISI